MTLKYMQGFETMREDSDFRAQGWVSSPTKKYVVPAPSSTGLVGTSLQLLGAGASSAATVPGAAGASDPGYFNTGVTINQAWLAGGFTFGCGARFNSGSSVAYGATGRVLYDGALYWSYRTGAGTNICTSPDLLNWTATPSQPSGSSLWYMGTGVMVNGAGAANASVIPYSWTSNNGTSWSNFTIAAGNTSQAGASCGGVASGNSTNPHVLLTLTETSPTSQDVWNMQVYVGNAATGAISQIVSKAGVISGPTDLPATFIGKTGTIVFCIAVTSMYTADSTTDISQASNWISAAISNAVTINDLVYNPTSNLYVVASSSGIYTFPNTGAAGNTVAPSGTQTFTARYTLAAINKIFWTGSQMVGFGNAGHIVTSPDGITWTETTGHIIPSSGAYAWATALYDGSRYVLFSDASSGVIATTPDGVTNYQTKYVSDSLEASAGYAGTLGVFGAPVFTSGTFTSGNNLSLSVAAAASGARTVTLYSLNNSKGTFSVPTTTLYHYYEIVATSVSGTSNNFTVQVFVDGLLVLTGTSGAQFGNTGDTTTIIGLQLGRNGAFTAWDDMYFTVNDGQGVVGPLGVVNIVAQRPETDVQAQWVKTGSAASNSLSVNQPALSSNSANYVSSSNAGDKDIYGTTDVLPSGYTPKAIMAEAFFTKTSTTAPVVSVGTLSGSSEVDGPGASITGTTAAYVNQIVERDPNGSAAWTAASVNAAKFVLNHTT